MEIGKVPNELLEEIVFKNITHKREEVLVRASIGEDTAIMDLGEDLCVLSTDPITGATKELGALAIHISCNDIATRGAEPIGVLLTVLCPEGTTEEELNTVMADAGRAAESVNVEIIGGHTEVTDGVNRIILSTTVIGRMKRQKLKAYDEISMDDNVVMTKWIGLEGTHILAGELEESLRDKMSQADIDEAKSLGKYLSVVKEGMIGGKLGVKYMHDITEGGIHGAIWETGKAIGKGILLEGDRLPIKDITKKVCDALDVDVKKLISSGSMIMVSDKDKTAELIKTLENEGILATVIGRVIDSGIFEVSHGRTTEISSPGSDELYRALGF